MAQRRTDVPDRLRALRTHIGRLDHPVLVVVLCVVCVLACCLGATRALSVSGGSAVRVETRDEAALTESAATEQVIYVDVEGAVAHPALYQLPAGSRVADAVEKAGGMTDDAVAGSLNLARVVQDGEQVAVPSSADAAQASATQQGGSSAAATATGLVNINLADEEQLQQLPGVGQATASKIVADRADNGPFSTTEDLMRVPGIGEGKYAQMKDLICV
ncbi:MAG: helix-hairpin-helix domain-containing protein [Coriobacteriales bacterium]